MAPTLTIKVDYGIGQRTVYGACPEKGGSSLGAARTVGSKYGQGSMVRQFASNFNTPQSDPSLGLVHTSYKVPSVPDVAAGAWDAQITAMAQAARPGDVVDLWHEPEDEVASGQFSLASYVAAKNRFYDLVKAAKPSVLVALTLMGWTVNPRSGRNLDQWGQVKADVLGIDCDGINVYPYPVYRDEITSATSFIARHASMGYRYWSVPEFGARRATQDPDGVTRAMWLTDHGNRFRDAGALYVALFDYGTPDSLQTPAELAVWRGFVASNH